MGKVTVVKNFDKAGNTPIGFGNNRCTIFPRAGHNLQGHPDIDLDVENLSISFRV